MNHQVKYHIFIVTLLIVSIPTIMGQTIDTWEKDDFYDRNLIRDNEAPPIPYLREDDVVWDDWLWRTIDLREKFNQYIYYPVEAEGLHGRKCLSRVIWNAVAIGQIPIFEDDEFKIPLDNDAYVASYTKADTIILEIVDEEENYEFQTVLVPKEFLSEDILQIKIKEVCYIEKNRSEQRMQTISLGLCKDVYKEIEGEREFIGTVTLFWIPINAPTVRNLLVRNEAYYEDNIAHLPSWLNIIESRMYESFITKESNRFNRTISSYLTGIDALQESLRIEYKLLNISEDMWEY